LTDCGTSVIPTPQKAVSTKIKETTMESIQGNIKLTIINGKAITTSRQIACHFDKRHKNVLRDIEN
jgi:glycine/serine hydroxymethyltransferase